MANKSKLERAVESRIADFNDAQKELALSQLSSYRRNLARLAQIEKELKAMDGKPSTREDVRLRQAHRAALAYEHGQLSTSTSRMAADLFEFMEE